MPTTKTSVLSYSNSFPSLSVTNSADAMTTAAIASVIQAFIYDCVLIPLQVVQHGRRMPLLIKKTKHKGWGVFNGAKKIRSGDFIGIYAGELLDERESHRRGL